MGTSTELTAEEKAYQEEVSLVHDLVRSAAILCVMQEMERANARMREQKKREQEQAEKDERARQEREAEEKKARELTKQQVRRWHMRVLGLGGEGGGGWNNISVCLFVLHLCWFCGCWLAASSHLRIQRLPGLLFQVSANSGHHRFCLRSAQPHATCAHCAFSAYLFILK